MNQILHIIATPRGKDSRTLKVSELFLSKIKEKNPQILIDELDLTKQELPAMNKKRVDGKYVLLGGKDLTGESEKIWQDIVVHIKRFLSADTYLISAPMWNFSIPYVLKHYIDVIIQPKYLFRYIQSGVEGLAKGKKMIVVTSRGGDYGTPQTNGLDFQEPYLRAVFGFVGIKDITFINAQPMDTGLDLQKQKIEEAKEIAARAADKIIG